MRQSRFDIEKAVTSLLVEAVTIGLVSSATRARLNEQTAQGLVDNDQARVVMLHEALAHREEHDTQRAVHLCTGAPCKKLAVSRALWELAEHGGDSAIQRATRNLAEVSFSLARDLRRCARQLAAARDRVESELGRYEDLYRVAGLRLRAAGDDTSASVVESSRLGMRERCYAALCSRPTRLFARIGMAADDLEGLDESARRLLPTSLDEAPRGGKRRNKLLFGVTQQLGCGGYSPSRIGKLVDDGGGGSAQQRAKRVRNRLATRDENGELIDFRTHEAYRPDGPATSFGVSYGASPQDDGLGESAADEESRDEGHDDAQSLPCLSGNR